ncbi:MAG: DUF3102 domain-containing protein [Oscillospiraceae bacterium]|nr:DUF3102 domain-containing protein [Oscillospiraceae bacterium]
MAGKFNLADHIQKSELPQARDIEVITGEILDAKRVGGEAILTIGKGLIEAKAVLPHGEWLPWLEDRVEISTRMAQNYMRLAQHYSNTNALSYLGATKALQLLALPESERDEFLNESHEVGGERKNVIDMTSRELAIAIKERDEALKEAERAKAEQSAAEQARQKMAEDMAVANERLAGLNAQIEEQYAQGKKWQKEIARLEVDLAKSKSRPVEVAVQADEAAVEAARKEAEERTRAKVEKEFKTARALAQEQVLAANEAAAQARGELAQAKRELDAVRFEAERAERRAALASNEDLVMFQVLLDQGQEIANKLGGVLMKLRNNDADMAGKLSQAVLVLSGRFKGVAEQ